MTMTVGARSLDNEERSTRVPMLRARLQDSRRGGAA